MANSDYSQVSTGTFCSVARLAFPVAHLSDVFRLHDVREVLPGDIAVGSMLMIGAEIAQVTSVALPAITVKRGCADTIPEPHTSGDAIFFVSGKTSIHGREYFGTETVSVKVLSKSNSGRVPIEYAAPISVAFKNRFARPYPPANVQVAGQPWFNGVNVTPSAPMTLTWVGRNRVVQADQILGHTDAGVTPEDGTTYQLRLTTTAGATVRTISGITGTSYTYTFEDMVADFEVTNGSGNAVGYGYFTAVRNGLTGWRQYGIAFQIDRSLITVTNSFINTEDDSFVLTEDASRIVLE